MLKGLKGILEKGLQIAAPILGGMIGGPGGSAIASGLASLLTGNKLKDAAMSAAGGYFAGKHMFPGAGGNVTGGNVTGSVNNALNWQNRAFGQNQTPFVKGPAKSNNIIDFFKNKVFAPRGTEGDRQPSFGMQALSTMGPGILSYLAAKQDADNSKVDDASEYMSAIDKEYGGQTARPGEGKRIQGLNVTIDETTGRPTYRAQGGIMNAGINDRISYPLQRFAQGGYPRKTGSINGPGTKTSDSIPAMLSDGEFVQRTDSVNGAGIMMGAKNAEEARQKGAQFMYALQDKLSKMGKRV